MCSFLPTGTDDGGVEGKDNASPPERCEALASAIAGVLGDTLREHEEQAAATARSQDGVAAAIDRLNGELDRLLENAPSLPMHSKLYQCEVEGEADEEVEEEAPNDHKMRQ